MKVDASSAPDPLAELLKTTQNTQTDLAEKLMKLQVGNIIDLSSLDTMGKLFDTRV